MRGRTWVRGEPGYEQARAGTLWNRRVPEGYPDVIVQASSVDDMVAGIQRARREGLRLTCSSGGHSWSCNQLRDRGLLLDLLSPLQPGC